MTFDEHLEICEVLLRCGMSLNDELLDFWRDISGPLLPASARKMLADAITELEWRLSCSLDEVDERIHWALEGYLFEKDLSMAWERDARVGVALNSTIEMPV